MNRGLGLNKCGAGEETTFKCYFKSRKLQAKHDAQSFPNWPHTLKVLPSRGKDFPVAQMKYQL